ncbi:hypothetical protein [Psychrobacillus sp. NPDC093180]|uniref:PglD-related sugar-binding protein n=1 Tax=Psychrobacillus sp. NPDC093180 TaxID=3364489 RepID=UPI00380552C3
MNKNLLILGAGGHGRVVKETAVAMGYFNKINFLDNQSELSIGKCEDIRQFYNNYSIAFAAFGDNEQRMKWIEELIEIGFQLPILNHPNAYVSPLARIEVGSIVCAKAVINTNAVIEKGSIISIGALVDHDCFIGEFSHINSGTIVKVGCRIDRLKKVDAGMVYSNKNILDNYRFEVGV